jgi:hypothetical protein
MSTLTAPETIATCTRTATLPNGDKLTATALLVHRAGNARPYFSLTGEVREPHKREPWCAGCIHGEIVEAFPDWAPLAAIHLADDTGTPMHALENARYWMGFSLRGAGRPMSPRGQYDPADEFETDANGLEWSPVRLARHLRVGVEHARELRAYVEADGNDTEALRFIVGCLAPQWAAEAAAALALIEKG